MCMQKRKKGGGGGIHNASFRWTPKMKMTLKKKQLQAGITTTVIIPTTTITTTIITEKTVNKVSLKVHAR